MSAKLENIFAIIARWMDGSLFFRGLVAVLNFFKKLCCGSFICRAFIADIKPIDNSVKRSYFMTFVDKILNGLPKPLASPMYLHSAPARIFKGSWLINSLADGINAPIPEGKNVSALSTFLQWVFFALPALGMGAILFAVPFLPTMMLGTALVPLIFLILLSRKFEIDGLTAFILIFILLSMIVATMSLVPRSSIQIAILTSIYAMSAPAIIAIIKTRKSTDFFILIFVASAGITGLFGMYQFFRGHSSDLWLDTELFAEIRGRITSTFGNPNVYATFLLLAIPITAACIIFFKNKFIKLCAMGATGLLLVNLLLTYSRGAYVALALSVFVFILLIEKRLVVLMMFFVAILPMFLPPTILARLLSIVNLTDTSTMFRMAIWQGSIRMIGDFWVSGIGQGLEAYHMVYPYYALAAAGTRHSHNLFLQMLVEVGLGGFLVFLGIVAYFFRVQANFLRNTQDLRLRVMSAAIVAGMIGFLIQSVFDYTFFNFSIVLGFYLFVGLGTAFARSYSDA